MTQQQTSVPSTHAQVPQVQAGLFSERLDTTPVTVQTLEILPPPNGRLLDSVKTVGVLQAVSLTELPADHKEAGKYRYQVVYGQRRVSSALHYGVPQVPAILVAPTDSQMAGLTVIENGDRSANIVAEARAIRTLLGLGYTPSDIEREFGMQTETIKVRRRLLALGDTVLDLVEAGKVLSESVALKMANMTGQYLEDAKAAVVAMNARNEEEYRTWADRQPDPQHPKSTENDPQPEEHRFSNKRLAQIKVRLATDSSKDLEGLALGDEVPLMPEVVEQVAMDVLVRQVQTMCSARNIGLSDLVHNLQSLLPDAPAEGSSGPALPLPEPAIDLPDTPGAAEVLPLGAAQPEVESPAPPKKSRATLTGPKPRAAMVQRPS